MLIIDKYAYTNNLKNFNPKRKFGYSMSLLMVSLVNKEPLIFLAIIMMTFIATVCWARIPLKKYLKIVSIPMLFLFTSIIAIIFSFSYSTEDFIWSLNTKIIYVGITEIGLNNALIVFLRALSSIGCMFFLTLTTPMQQQLYILKKLHLPDSFLDIYALTYRFIFILLDEVALLYNALELKFGFINIRKSYKSLSILIKSLFYRVMKRYQDMIIALELKLYIGEFYIGQVEEAYVKDE